MNLRCFKECKHHNKCDHRIESVGNCIDFEPIEIVSRPVERVVMPNEVVDGGKIDINQIVSRIKQLLLLNKEMLEEAPPDYKKMAESNALTVLLHWIENQRGA